MDWWFYPILVLAGIAAGFINTLAGSGSLITLPLLIFLGLPANTANGTNRVAILCQNVIGVSRFCREGVLDTKKGKWFLVPAVIGAIVGAQIAVDLNDKIMRLTIGIMMVVMLTVMIAKPQKWLKKSAPTEGSEKKGLPMWLAGPLFFLIGLYGGFIQAGVGIFLLAALVMGAGYDLVRANALKLLVVFAFTPLALVVFLLNGQVEWGTGFILALGNMIGAWLGTKVAIKHGAPFIHMLLVAVVTISAVKLFWDALAG
ncbi:MAG: hypothetical protein CSA81_07540 [Acidobacteria bacterium]|nr:MAG: hypothetical protein CSA81_07540 [Acidobacteriota bacterium]